MLQKKILPILTVAEKKLFRRLSTPHKIQDYLDTLPINFEEKGETYMSVRRTLEANTAHCLEGALVAAAALLYHGQKPLLMDFQTTYGDEDHVIALYRENGYWGAISKTNHSILRYRDPIYKTPRELALSYFHEYFMHDGRKSLRAYSAPFDLSKYSFEKWVSAKEELFWLAEAIDKSKHFPIIAKKNERKLRKVSRIELTVLDRPEWPRGTKH